MTAPRILFDVAEHLDRLIEIHEEGSLEGLSDEQIAERATAYLLACQPSRTIH